MMTTYQTLILMMMFGSLIVSIIAVAISVQRKK